MPDDVLTNDVLRTLQDRATWYREGCPGLEDRDRYFATGDLARDAASDLESALSEIRVLEMVIAKLRQPAQVIDRPHRTAAGQCYAFDPGEDVTR